MLADAKHERLACQADLAKRVEPRIWLLHAFFANVVEVERLVCTIFERTGRC